MVFRRVQQKAYCIPEYLWNRLALVSVLATGKLSLKFNKRTYPVSWGCSPTATNSPVCPAFIYLFQGLSSFVYCHYELSIPHSMNRFLRLTRTNYDKSKFLLSTTKQEKILFHVLAIMATMYLAFSGVRYVSLRFSKGLWGCHGVQRDISDIPPTARCLMATKYRLLH